MGYRSEVAYVIAFDNTETMGKFITWVFGSDDEYMITALKECEVDFDTMRINFYQSDVKWYESYPDVQGHTRLYELCDNDDTPFHNKCGYKFYRIGEEQNDIDDFEGGMNPPYDDFYVVSTLELPFKSEYKSYATQLEEAHKQSTKPKE